MAWDTEIASYIAYLSEILCVASSGLVLDLDLLKLRVPLALSLVTQEDSTPGPAV
jgi:hypothetical protein